MTNLDFNTAKEQTEFGEPIPEGTIATVQINVRPGGAGEGGWLKRSQTGSAGIDAEFTVVDGQHAKRKFWKLFTLDGPSDGHVKAAEISASQIRGILESARGIKPDDQSDTAKAARIIKNWGDLDGLRFIAKIGIEKGGPKKDGSGNYSDKNTLAVAITPDKQQWKKVEQIVTAQAAPVVAKAAQSSNGKPPWAA